MADTNFNLCCDFVVKSLEGKPTNDPNDPGGFTIWGLASRYNTEVRPNMTYEEAKRVYRKKYWTQECRDAEWPLDLVFFDASVNPQNDPGLSGTGNDELIRMCGPWRDADAYLYAVRFLVHRAGRYARRSSDKYVRGHVQRCERVLNFIESKGDTR